MVFSSTPGGIHGSGGLHPVGTGRTRIRGWPQLASFPAFIVRMMLALYVTSTLDRKGSKPEVVFVRQEEAWAGRMRCNEL